MDLNKKEKNKEEEQRSPIEQSHGNKNSKSSNKKDVEPCWLNQEMSEQETYILRIEACQWMEDRKAETLDSLQD